MKELHIVEMHTLHLKQNMTKFPRYFFQNVIVSRCQKVNRYNCTTYSNVWNTQAFIAFHELLFIVKIVTLGQTVSPHQCLVLLYNLLAKQLVGLVTVTALRTRLALRLASTLRHSLGTEWQVILPLSTMVQHLSTMTGR